MSVKNAGFSLIELVVAITIGGVILATVMGSYLSLAQVRQNLDITRQLQREVNFAAMRISDRARAYSVNYEELDADNHHYLPLGDDEFEYDAMEKELTMNGAPLFSPNVEVSELNFTVFPTAPSNRVQTKVTLEFRVTSRVKPEISVPLRTTISSRLIK